MSRGRGKAIALASVAAGGVVIVTCVVCSWGTLCEEWYLRQLDSKDLAARRAAVESLAEMASLRSMPRFLESLTTPDPSIDPGMAGAGLQKIIDRRGQAAEPYLAAYLARRDRTWMDQVVHLTLRNFPRHAGALEVVARALKDGRDSVRHQQLTLLTTLGEDPVPCLGKVLLEAESENVREWGAFMLEGIGAGARSAAPALLEATRDRSAPVRVAASCALATLGAKEAVYRDGLLEGLRLEDVGQRQHALTVVREVGRSSLPILIGALGSGWPEAQLWACLELQEIGPQGKSAVPILEDLFAAEASTDDAVAVRCLAALALREMDRPAEDLLPWFAEGIWIGQYRIDEMALAAIEELGSDAGAILPALLEDLHVLAGDELDPQGFSKLSRAILAVGREALPDLSVLVRDAEPRVRALALMVLRDMKSAARPAIPALREALRDPDAEVALFAAWALAGFEDQAPEALPLLIEAMEREDDLERKLEFLKFLGHLGAAARPAAGEIIRALNDRDWVFRLAAVESLGRVGAPAAEAVPPLIRALRDRERTVRWAAAAALREFGPQAASAARVLETALTGSDPLAIWAAFALMAIEPSREAEHFRTILEALRSTSPLERSEAVRALGLMGPRARAALPELIGMATGEDLEPIRVLAVDSIARIGIVDGSSLRKLLACDEAATRSRAARCLAAVRPLPEDLLPSLAEALKDPEEAVRAPAARALGNLGPSARAATGALREAEGDRCFSVRHAAKAALKEISRAARGS